MRSRLARSANGDSVLRELGSLMLTAEIAVTGAVSLSPSAMGRMHVCTGTSADYEVDLPTTLGVLDAGSIIGFRMGTTTALTKIVTLDAGASLVTDGQRYRLMWSNEVAILLWTGTTWTKIGGRSIPLVCSLARSSGQTVVTATVTLIDLDVANIDSAGMADLSSDRINIKRTSNYVVKWQTVYTGTAATGTARLHKNGNNLENGETAGGQRSAQSCTAIPLAAADYLDLRAYHTEGSDRSCSSNLIVAQEVPSW